MNFSLPDKVASSQDLMALILDVKEYARWYDHESIKKQANVASEAKEFQPSPICAEILRDWSKTEPLSKQRLDELITTLETYQKKAPSMTITLAAPASRGLKTQLVSWCRTNIAPGMLVTFDFNATLLGGMVVRFGSHVHDWSIRRAVIENKAKLPEVLRRV